MRYWTHSSGATSSRTFTLDEIREQLQTGQLSPSDRICLDGQTNWQRIEDAVPLDGPPPPPPGEPYGMPPLPGAATGNRRGLKIAAMAGATVCVLAVLAFFLLSGRSLPSTAKYVPDDSLFVTTIYTGELFRKSGIEDILDKGMLGAIIDDGQIEDQVKKILKDPVQLGINLNEPTYIFIRPSDKKDDDYPVIGFTIPLVGKDAFIEGTHEFAQILDGRDRAEFEDFRDELKRNGFYEPEDGIHFSINEEVLLVLIQEGRWREGPEANLANMSQTILTGDSGLADKSESFLAHQKDSFKFDVGMWSDLMPVLKLAAEQGDAIGNVSALGNELTVAGGIRFDTGEIAGKLALTYDADQLGDWSGDGIPAKLLDAVPEDAIFAISQSMNMDAVKKYLNAAIRKDMMQEISEELDEELGLSMDELLNAIKGDFVLGIKMEMKESRWGGREPTPAFTFGASINDASIARRILEPMEGELDREGYSVVIEDDAVFIRQNGGSGKPISGDKRAALEDHDFGMFVDAKDIVREIEKDVREGSEEDLAVDYLKAIKLFTITGDAEAGAQNYVARLMLEDTSDNSLKLIVDKTVGFVIKMQKRMREFEKEWDVPDAKVEMETGEDDAEWEMEKMGPKHKMEAPEFEDKFGPERFEKFEK